MCRDRFDHLETNFKRRFIIATGFSLASIFSSLRKSLTFCFNTVPSLPPQNLRGINISSTALKITWNPVPAGFVHGILRGYRVLYRKTNEPSAPYTEITVSPRVRVREIYGLKKFTFYTIRILAFTIKGDGAESSPVNVSTDEDSKYKISVNDILQTLSSIFQFPVMHSVFPPSFA